MRIEVIKSIILTILVLLSIVLFWSIVTFQINDDFTENEEYVQEVKIDSRKEIKELIFPNKIIFRADEEVYNGTQNMEKIKPILRDMQHWKIYEFENNRPDLRKKLKQVPANQVLILQYPGNVPFEFLKSMFQVEGEQVPTGSFQSAYIFMNDMGSNEGFIYFTSKDFDTIIEAKFHSSYLPTFVERLTQWSQDETESYRLIEKANGESLYVLDEEITLQDYKYYTNEYQEDIFIHALFANPAIVTQDENVYTNGSSILTFHRNSKHLTFVNTTVPKTPLSVTELLKSAIDYVNGHSGWTHNYYFSGVYQPLNKVTFQWYSNSFPVFSDLGLSEIELVIGDKKIHSYKRPYIKEYVPYPNLKRKEYKLPTGEEVIAYLQKKEVNIQKVEDLVVGYKVEGSLTDSIITLSPSWFYRIGDRWEHISLEELEGMNNGLEQS